MRVGIALSACLLLVGCRRTPQEGDAPGATGPSANSAPCFHLTPYVRGNAFAVPPPLRVPEPQLHACARDPEFGAEVCKVADANQFAANESQGVVRPVYSRWRLENSTGDLYFLVKAGETPPDSGKGQLVVFRTSNDSAHSIIDDVFSAEDAEFRWDYSPERPTTLYYRQDCQLRSYDIISRRSVTVRDFAKDFPGCGRILNDVEGDSSADSRYWAFMVQGRYDGSVFPMLAIVTYDRLSDTIVGVLDRAAYVALGGTGKDLPRPNMVDMAPSGQKVVLLFGRTDKGDAFDGPHAFDLTFKNPIKVCNDETHSGWAFDQAGEEVFVCQINSGNWANAPADTIAATNIRSGRTIVMVFHEDLGWDVGGFHFGRVVNPSIRGWVYLTTYSETVSSKSWLRNQAAMIEIKPHSDRPRIWRIAQTFNDYPGKDGYPREAYSPLTSDGQRVYWGADWIGGDGTVDTYRVRLPDRWWEVLAGNPTVCKGR